MGYASALEAAGKKVLAIEYFGSYQGEWLAKVQDEFTGEIGYVHDWFGSCTVCDSFQAEMDYDYPYDDDPQEKKDAYQARLREFGQRYTIMPESWMQEFLWPSDADDDDYVSYEREEMRVWFAKVREGEHD